MAEHDALTGYLFGELGPAETAAFEMHLGGCPECRLEVAELDPLPRLLVRAAPRWEVPRDLEARTFAAIANGCPARPTRRRLRWSWPVLAGAAGSLAAAAVVLVLVLGGGSPQGERLRLVGEDADVIANVVTTGVGREVTLDIRQLEDPRPNGLYELWFVGPDDTRRRPQRVSAGTFHPDDQGRGTVRLVAAAAPERYPRISVTLEPNDGNPRRTGLEVLRVEP